MKDILVLIGMFVAGILFMWIRQKIFKGVKKFIKGKMGLGVIDIKKERIRMLNEPYQIKTPLNASIGNVYKKNGEEVFQWKKFKKTFSLLGAGSWGKTLSFWFNFKNWTIILFIVGILMGWSYWKGQQGKPIIVPLGYGKEAKIDLNGEYLHIDKTGNVYLKDTKTDKIIKHISVKDIGGLKRKLAPFGFEFTPIAFIGMGLGKAGAEGEGGVGLSWLRYHKYRIQSFITNRGFYPIGLGYKITDNAGLTIGVGKGWKGDERVTIGFHFEF